MEALWGRHVVRSDTQRAKSLLENCSQRVCDYQLIAKEKKKTSLDMMRHLRHQRVSQLWFTQQNPTRRSDVSETVCYHRVPHVAELSGCRWRPTTRDKHDKFKITTSFLESKLKQGGEVSFSMMLKCFNYRFFFPFFGTFF